MERIEAGKKVVCINDRFFTIFGVPLNPKPLKDKDYTIDGIDFDHDGVPFLSLSGFSGYFWDSRQFRLIDYDFVNKVMEYVSGEVEQEELVTV